MIDRKEGVKDSALRESLLEESREALVALSLDGRVLLWNRAAQALTGVAPAEACGRVLVELVTEGGHRDPLERAIAQASECEGGAIRLETVWRRLGGAQIAVDLALQRVEAAGDEIFLALSAR